MAAIACYFDESYDQGRGIYVIAAYVGTVEMWDSYFESAWRDAITSSDLPISEFKARDCYQGQGEFKAERGWSRPAREELASKVAAVVCNAPEELLSGVSAALLLPIGGQRSYKRNSETLGFHQCFLSALQFISFTSTFAFPDRELVIYCDRKDGFHSRAVDAFELARKNLVPEFGRLLRTPVFRESHEALPVQAADMLAFETNKEIRSRIDGAPSPNQRLESLVASRPHLGMCLDALECLQELRRTGFPGRVSGDLVKWLYLPRRPLRCAEVWPFKGKGEAPQS